MIGSILALLLVSSPPSGDVTSGLRWERNFDDAMKRARAAKKPLMVDFWAAWCGWCHRLDRTTYVDPQVVQMAQDFIPVKVNTEGTPREAAVALRYDVSSLPTIAFISPAGHLILRLSGYQGPGQFPVTMEQARETAALVMGWEAALAKNPYDAAALLGLASHLFDQEAYNDSRELLERSIKGDGERPSAQRKRARLLLAAILKTHDGNYSRAESLLKDGLAIRPAGEFDAKLLYVLGKTYLSWGKRDEARAVLQQIVTAHAASPVAEKARETLVALDRRK